MGAGTARRAALLVLENAVFALLPVPLLDGGELLQHRPYAWFASFPLMLATWLCLTWRLTGTSTWSQLASMTAALLAAALVSYALWAYVRRRAAREAAAALAPARSRDAL